MSSTNRSNARDSHISDYYVTPQKAIREFLIQFQKDENINLSTQQQWILDPCAWWDKENDMSYPAVLFEMWADYDKIITNDLREDSPAQYHYDFITNTKQRKYDIVITNPPFNEAQKIIEKSLECTIEWWYVIMLLRLNYFWWKVRQNFWKKYMPIRTYIHNRRMSFTPDWKTDSVEYCHVIWKKGENPDFIKTKILFDFK